MGIPGLWDEFRDCYRETNLLELSTTCWNTEKRCLKIAVDAAIWSVQIQASQGGTNPALRTLFYRLCHFLEWGINVVFVFDGPNKPPWKRNRHIRSDVSNDSGNYRSMKHLIQLFGMQVWNAPGEAEAECAKLQRLGLIDYVLTEDVDAFAFGATKVIRNGSDAKKPFFKVRIYEMEKITEELSVNHTGIILIGLMRGGDYHLKGIEHCGLQTAIGAAKLGFGDSLVSSDSLNSWRSQLQNCIRTNKNNTFGYKRPNFTIEQGFPDPLVKHYYTNPEISSEHKLKAHFSQVEWSQKPDIQALYTYAQRRFQWINLHGNIKFVNNIAYPLLIFEVLHSTAKDSKYYKASHKTRRQKSTGMILEKQITFYPNKFLNCEWCTETNVNDNEANTSLMNQWRLLLKESTAWVPACFIKTDSYANISQFFGRTNSDLGRLVQKTKRLSLDPEESGKSMYVGREKTTVTRKPPTLLSTNLFSKSHKELPSSRTLLQATDDSFTDDDLPKVHEVLPKSPKKAGSSKQDQLGSRHSKDSTIKSMKSLSKDQLLKRIYIRESLNGTWKEDLGTSGRRKMYENIPIIDLS
ncbi:XPG I region-containing protein [Schizosaccharomyces cryophilus OY26]|uniref:XPG I region-containing protein n=1 Tax=Schizosaccharomyces cryophilus (strain OY26 / ATCC MYA-4695 / CBS 11777 / NBRC 106824 / NRRL Y48691) TaxID=653667 RepID=S9VZP2_SCHCR|nr:XPG I region-containing protein [Schizosaccharomyces cryophilus OY26]EPY51300.1 XPG I region-containing protein [Schizosaccharomyces cryophilus OY26]